MVPFQPERYRPYLQMLARCGLRGTILKQKIDPSDLVQDTLVRALDAAPQFRGTTEQEFAGWLRVILAHQLADAARRFNRQKRDVGLETSCQAALEGSARGLERLAAHDTTPSQQVLQHERIRYVSDALDQLPADQREVVELHHLLGLSVAEVATEMGTTRASVAGLLRRGLQTLRAHLKHLDSKLR